MKKEIFALALLILIFAVSMINAWYLGSLADEITVLVEDSAYLASAGQWDQALNQAKAAADLWRSHDPYTHIVLRHSDIEAMTDDFYELLEHISSKDPGAAESSASLVAEHIESISEMERLRPGSIF